MNRSVIAATLILGSLVAMPASAQTCTATGFTKDGINMTAARINPEGTVTGVVDAAGCNIGVYYDHTGLGGTVKAEVKNANYFGVVVNGDAGSVAVDVIGSKIHDIGESPLNGTQHGVAIYYSALTLDGSATGKVSGNDLSKYQKGGIVVKGTGANVIVSGNKVTGEGRVAYIAQNGIQFSNGASGSAMKNTVTAHAYIGSNNAASGGILVVGGACYGQPLTTGIQIAQNTLTNNDVGVYLSNLDTDCLAPADQTNVKVVNNIISNDAFTNLFPYQAGVSDVGNNDKILNNTISGLGYEGLGVRIDADLSFTNRPKVHEKK